MDSVVTEAFFTNIVAHQLGNLEGDGCRLFSSSSIGEHKVVEKVEPDNLLNLAFQVHENCFGLAFVAAAKLYRSDELLPAVLLIPEWRGQANLASFCWGQPFFIFVLTKLSAIVTPRCDSH